MSFLCKLTSCGEVVLIDDYRSNKADWLMCEISQIIHVQERSKCLILSFGKGWLGASNAYKYYIRDTYILGPCHQFIRKVPNDLKKHKILYILVCRMHTYFALGFLNLLWESHLDMVRKVINKLKYLQIGTQFSYSLCTLFIFILLFFRSP